MIEPEFSRQQQDPGQFDDRFGAIGGGSEVVNHLVPLRCGRWSVEDADIEFFGDGGRIVEFGEPSGEVCGGRLQPLPDQGPVDQEQGLWGSCRERRLLPTIGGKLRDECLDVAGDRLVNG